MTSIAFIMGVMPLVTSTGAGSEMRHAMGIAVFFGMLGVTFFGLFLTPVFYVLLRTLDKRHKLHSAAPTKRRSPRKAWPKPPEKRTWTICSPIRRVTTSPPKCLTLRLAGWAASNSSRCSPHCSRSPAAH
jgi:hypothetical protein